MKTKHVLVHLAAGFVASPLVTMLILAGPAAAHVVRKQVLAHTTPPAVATVRLVAATELVRQERLEAYEREEEPAAEAEAEPAPSPALAPEAAPEAARPAPKAAVAIASAPGTSAAPPFSANEARSALGANLDSLPICRRGDASGRGMAEVVWTPDGNVAAVTVSSPYAGTATGACIARRFRSARIPAFASTGPMAMQVRFEL